MMKRSIISVSVSLLALAAMPLSAQQLADVRSAVLFESYSFDSGLTYEAVSQITIPVGIDVQLGRLGNLTISGGWTSVSLSSQNTSALDDQSQGSPLDTEARLSMNVIPGRLVILANGAIPTGVKTLDTRDELNILGAISSDIIGFTTSQLATGGNVGGGFAGAVPIGRWALGLGGTYRYPLSYVPVLGADTLKPGPEFRMRVGVEGPVGRRSYIRVAGIFARRSKDEVGTALRHGVGNRYVGYASLNQGVGSSALVLYGFNVFRDKPQIEQTALGTAILPRGNLIVAGARWAFRMGTQMSLSPRAEFRLSTEAVDETSAKLKERGRSLRFGLDWRNQFSRNAAIVLQADGVTGFVTSRETWEDVGLRGFRLALHTEITP